MNQPNSNPSIRAVRRKRLAASPDGLISANTWPQLGNLPMVVEAKVPGLRLSAWAEGRRAQIEAWLDRHAAVLFRGFAVDGVADFERCVDVLAGGAEEYKFRASPRTQVGNNIYTATDYPADQSIFPHNEHSYSPICPLELVFYAEIPSRSGGETPIGDTREVMRRIDPAIIERFVRKGILYVRNYGAGFGLPWRKVFQTGEREKVERYCAELGIRCEWKSGDRLRTRQVGPAVVRHPRNGEPVWFNHGTFFHVTTLPPAIRDALLAEFDEDDLPQNTYYGDGSPIESEVLEQLRAAYQESMVDFGWQQGDVMLVDNILSVHARRPYTGFRRVLVAMARLFRTADHTVIREPWL
ncbi:MAG: TauD/TfdA family dioxygenase [Methylococcales bacterium]